MTSSVCVGRHVRRHVEVRAAGLGRELPLAVVDRRHRRSGAGRRAGGRRRARAGRSCVRVTLGTLPSTVARRVPGARALSERQGRTDACARVAPCRWSPRSARSLLLTVARGVLVLRRRPARRRAPPPSRDVDRHRHASADGTPLDPRVVRHRRHRARGAVGPGVPARRLRAGVPARPRRHRPGRRRRHGAPGRHRARASPPSGEGGLLGLARRARRSRPTSWSTPTSPRATDNRIVRMTLRRHDQLGAPQVVLVRARARARSTTAAGSRSAPTASCTSASATPATRELAQDLDSRNGKILRITTDGEPAPGNPFPGSPVYSYGHRNVQGLAWDATRRLWASEFGQNTLGRAQPDRARRQLRLARSSRARATDAQLHRPGRAVAHRRRVARAASRSCATPCSWPALRGAAAVADRRSAAARPARRSDYFVGEYGRLRTVVVAPDGIGVGRHAATPTAAATPSAATTASCASSPERESTQEAGRAPRAGARGRGRRRPGRGWPS